MTLSRPLSTHVGPARSDPSDAAPGQRSAIHRAAGREATHAPRAVPQLVAATASSCGDVERDAAHLDALIETICAQGCKTVYQVMARLQAGQTVPELAHLSRCDSNRVLVELDSIMAVYAENGSVCLTNGNGKAADSKPSN